MLATLLFFLLCRWIRSRFQHRNDPLAPFQSVRYPEGSPPAAGAFPLLLPQTVSMTPRIADRLNISTFFRRVDREAKCKIYASVDVTYWGHVTSLRRVKMARFVWTEETENVFSQGVREKCHNLSRQQTSEFRFIAQCFVPSSFSSLDLTG